MRILDKYIATTFIISFLASLGVFFSLYIIIDIFGHLDEIIKAKMALSTLGKYYMAFTPNVFVEIAPIGALLAIVYTLSRLNNSNEIIAMRSAGLSIWQITKPVLICGLIISFIVFFANEKIVPASQYKLSEIKVKEMGSQDGYASEQLIKNAAIYGLENKLFFLRSFDPKSNKLSGIVVLEQDQKQNVLTKVVANTGEYKEGHWIFYDCIIYHYNENNQLKGDPLYLQAKVMDYKDTPADIKKQQLQISYMNIKQLSDYRQRLSSSNAKQVLRNFDVEIHKRFAFPLSTTILMLMSIPFSLSIRKKGRLISSLGISMGLGFFYYVLNSVSIAFGKEGIILPFISAWLINVVFFIIGMLLIKNLP